MSPGHYYSFAVVPAFDLHKSRVYAGKSVHIANRSTRPVAPPRAAPGEIAGHVPTASDLQDTSSSTSSPPASHNAEQENQATKRIANQQPNEKTIETV
jgi:hypothetical protein